MLVSAGLVAAMASTPWAVAGTHEDIIEKCRQAMMPQIQACARAKGLRGNLEAVKQQCGFPLVHPCVIREEQSLSARTPAPAVPKEEIALTPGGATPIQTTFVAPPRTIADITAILDSDKPNDAKIVERKATADAAPPANASRAQLVQFYYDRGSARALLARNKEALDDGLKAIEIGKGTIDLKQLSRIRQFVALRYKGVGDSRQAIATFESIVRDGAESTARGTMINALYNIASIYVSMGDINQAGTYAGRVQALVSEARGSPNPNWRKAYAIYGRSWEADNDTVRGVVFEARGQYADAEAAYRRADAFRRAAVKDIPNFEYRAPVEQMVLAADYALLWVARTETKQGRLSEAEADARRALLSHLQQEGKYAPTTPPFIVGLAGILVEQGRYQEAEKLARTALDIERTLGIPNDAPEVAGILSQLGNMLVLQRKTKEAAGIYADLDKAVAQWPPAQREAFLLNGSRIAALYASGQIDAGIAAAEQLLKAKIAHTGDKSFDTAAARGMLAVGYARAGRDADAIREFKAAIPVLLTAARENSDDDDPTVVAARNTRLQRIVETYIGVLAHVAKDSNAIAIETFGLADAVRGHAVQKALADSSARAVATDPALAELVRQEQDLAKQISAELGALNNLLAQPADQRDEATVRATNAALEKLRTDRKAARAEINRRFPAYADLIDPKPPSVDDIRASLRPGEALLSFYFGQDASFVWAVPKEGAVAFAAVGATAAELETKVHKLRQALAPQIAMVSEIPPFDLTLAYQLYGSLLKPVEAGWKGQKSLIVVTNGALGELPLGLLPTARAQVDLNAKPLFAGYRDVPWLARTHAVTVIPSASALITLRRLPAGSPQREKLIGFGDPYFNEQQAAEAEGPPPGESASTVVAANDAGSDAVTRGLPLRRRASPHTEDVDKAELAMLPRLPDTRQELTAMASALDVDPAKTLYLGKAANEQNVETMDLAHVRIIAFATHGLVPGDIDGLTQPALALTAPQVAGIKGNGLLTMENILALKLDADWVVLSACNTAAGAGAGAEAASGLGSAFFYAGTRALLVTNWSVHSASARELTTDLFRRSGSDPHLSRAEALRQAMMDLVDGPGFVDSSGKTVFSYAHPLFWAPYSLIGDGGAK